MGRNIKRLFFDLETSPNIVWTYAIGHKIGINHGQIIQERAIVCGCWKWQDEDEVHSITWTKGKDDKRIIKAITPVIEKADEVVAHNGDRFDIKWLRTRAFLHRLPFPAYIKSIDTLKKARGKFLFNSNRLDYISKVTGGHGKLEYGGQSTLNKIYLDNDQEALSKYVEYCKVDVIELQRIYELMQDYIEPDTHVGVMKGNERYSCPKCGSCNIKRQGKRVYKTGTVRYRMKCKDCDYKYSLAQSVFNWFMQDRLDGKI
jgi:predicted RNA-binding Zn-ribbon protein involved in translation (DUF1610 family)